MRGWIIDCHPDGDDRGVVLWLRTERGVERIVDRGFRPSLLVQGDTDELLRSLRAAGMGEASRSRARVELGKPPREVVRITPDRFSKVQRYARTIDRWGGYRRFRLFNVDLRLDQRYFLRRRIFPHGLVEYGGEFSSLDSPHRLDYPLAPLTSCTLEVGVRTHTVPRLEDPIGSIALDGEPMEGDEEGMLREMMAQVRRRDPDVLYTRGGDRFYLGYLAERASRYGMELDLGREGGVRRSRGKSYFTYGRIVHKPSAHKLRGRMHIDTNSFMVSESGLQGIIDLSRLCLIPVQDLSRLSPGSAISAMQVNHAARTGHVVLWKKNLPEGFKTATHLIAADRGGMIFQPRTGVFEGVTELDFSSLYPSIMVEHNISPETMLCDCCPDSSRRVPELGYHICERRIGLLPQVLEPIIRRRRAYKRMMREMPGRREVFEQRAKLLKWVLVTCFGYTGYRNARFGRIECHEAITAYGREILLAAAEMAEERGFEVLHGIVDSLWLEGDGDVGAFQEEVRDRFHIPLELEGRYRWMAFLPNVTNGVGALNRYYGLFEDGSMKVRGIALRRRDTVPLVRRLQEDILGALSAANDVREFMDAVPEALEALLAHHRCLASGEVPAADLVITRSVSRELPAYRQFNDTVAALRQLRTLGAEVNPGESVQFVVLDSGSRDPRERVRVAPMMGEREEYDVARYTDLLVRGTAEMLAPAGWDQARLRELLDLRGGR